MKIQNRYKPLIFIGIGVLLLAFFFWFVTRQSIVDKAVKELNAATDYNKVKAVWNDHKNDLASNSKWIAAIQDQLSKMPLMSEQQIDLATWFPIKTYINVVILPDLSGRLITEPYPTDNDKVVIDYIWQAFRESVRKSYILYGGNTKDRLMIDMTRERELQLAGLASKLIVDCSKTQKPSIPYLNEIEESFHKAVDEVYAIAGKKTQGADYYKYINENLNDRRIDSSPFVKFRNLVIILTDGYLETTKGSIEYYTGSPSQLSELRKGRQNKKAWEQLFSQQRLLIQDLAPSTPKLNGWEVLILQVRDRKGSDGDFEILKKLWSDWLTTLGAKWIPEISFQKYQIAPTNNKNVIANFFGIESLKLSNSSTSVVIQKETIQNTTIDNKDYDKLIGEAEQAVANNDFDKGKLLLRKAAQIQQIANMPISPKAESIYQKYVQFADKACQTFQETRTKGLQDIPIHYYELAGLIKPSADVQRKLADCTNP